MRYSGFRRSDIAPLRAAAILRHHAAAVLPPPFSFMSASVGGALADLLAGYAVWAIPTAIIKALNVLPFVIVKIILNRFID